VNQHQPQDIRASDLLIGLAVLCAILGVIWGLYDRKSVPSPEEALVTEASPSPTPDTVATPTPADVAGLEDPNAPAAPGEDPLMKQKIVLIRNEIKVSLSSAYSAEKSYYDEYGRYTSDLRVMGWLPQAALVRSRLGFLSPFQPSELQMGEDPRTMDSDAFIGEQEMDYQGKMRTYAYDKSAEGFSLQELEHNCEDGCTATSEHFEILAAAMLPNGQIDAWRINDRKELTHLTPEADVAPTAARPADGSGEAPSNWKENQIPKDSAPAPAVPADAFVNSPSNLPRPPDDRNSDSEPNSGSSDNPSGSSYGHPTQ